MCSSDLKLPSLEGWGCATPLDRALRHQRRLQLLKIQQAAQALQQGKATELSSVLGQADDWASRLRGLAQEVSVEGEGLCVCEGGLCVCVLKGGDTHTQTLPQPSSLSSPRTVCQTL